MKRLLLFIFILPLISFSQTYPLHEGFEGLPSTQVPVGWGGSMKVLLYHGLNDSKGLAARVSSAVTVDSSITPLIGPLTASSFISFYYRIIDQNIYPSTPTNLDSGDQIEILASTDSINYQVIQLIDMNNHNPSFNFVKKKIFVPQYADSNAYFKIRVTYTTGNSFYADFDTLVVDNDLQSGVKDVADNNAFLIYPNPCNGITNLQLLITNSTEQEVSIFNAVGEKIFQKTIASSYQLPTSAWCDGIYLVQFNNETETLTRKLIVQH